MVEYIVHKYIVSKCIVCHLVCSCCLQSIKYGISPKLKGNREEFTESTMIKYY